MYIKNKRDCSNIKSCSPRLRQGFGGQAFQLSCNMKDKCSITAYYSYTNRHDTIIHPGNSVAMRKYLINRGHDVKMELCSAAHKIPISKIPLIREFIEQSMVIKPS